VRLKGGFYHDGRFESYEAIVAHYDRVHRLGFSAREAAELAGIAL